MIRHRIKRLEGWVIDLLAGGFTAAVFISPFLFLAFITMNRFSDIKVVMWGYGIMAFFQLDEVFFGASTGKRRMGLTVVDLSGKRADGTQLVIRCCLKCLPFFACLPLALFIDDAYPIKENGYYWFLVIFSALHVVYYVYCVLFGKLVFWDYLARTRVFPALSERNNFDAGGFEVIMKEKN